MSAAPDQVQPYEGDQPYLFISYSRKDLDAIKPILQSLADRGVRLWWDLGLHPGEEYGVRLEQLVDGSAGLVVFLSPNSTKQKKSQNWVLSETKHAAEGGKEVVPVMLEECALPLEWKALVEHRQIVVAGRAGGESVVQGIVDRAKALGCIPAPEAPSPATKKVVKTKEGRKRLAKDAWLQGCMDAIDQLQRIVFAMFAADGDKQEPRAPWETVFDYGDETDEPPDLAIAFPLKADTDERYSRCRDLVAAADDLLDPVLPVAERLTNCLRFTEKIPASRDDDLRLALGLCHLYHLTALVRIHADAHEAPGAETINRLNRASTLMTGSAGQHCHPSVYELLRLAYLNLDVARLELALMAGLPDSKSLALAKTKGILAYSDEWRTRIISAGKLEQELWCYTTTEGDWTCTIANAFHSAWTLGEWITCCYRDLMQPGVFGAIPATRLEGDDRMCRRGADLAMAVRSQMGWYTTMRNLIEAGELLAHCYRPPLEYVWERKVIAHEQRAKLWLVAAKDCICADRREFSCRFDSSQGCFLLLARLLTQPFSGLLGGMDLLGSVERDLLVEELGRHCIRWGLEQGDHWCPTWFLEHDELRVLLWAESRRAVLEGARHAEDVLFLAGECDPSREMITLAKSHFFFTPPEQKSRVAEILAQPDAANLRRAGWLPDRFYQGRPERVPDDLRALLS